MALDALFELSEDEADIFLEKAGSSRTTPGGWDYIPKPHRRLQIARLIVDQTPHVRQKFDRLARSGPEGSDASSGDDTAAETDQTRDDDGQADVVATSPEVTRKGVGATVAEEGRIFVVHGRAHAVLHELLRVLERATGHDVVVLHEQANAGRTILEKFEEHAAEASYAVVLLTADDEGGPTTSAERQPRGRQNVIFELDFFFGTLGRRRVAVLLDPGVEQPSDINGLVYVSLDPPGAWKHQLARELQSAGMEINYARIPEPGAPPRAPPPLGDICGWAVVISRPPVSLRTRHGRRVPAPRRRVRAVECAEMHAIHADRAQLTSRARDPGIWTRSTVERGVTPRTA